MGVAMSFAVVPGRPEPGWHPPDGGYGNDPLSSVVFGLSAAAMYPVIRASYEQWRAWRRRYD